MGTYCKATVRPAYYFSTPDYEILDDHMLALSSDEDTWLYKIEAASLNGTHFELGTQIQNYQKSSKSDMVDSRTFTRRKHCSLRPSLEAVVESPIFNRSSLGILDASTLLNDTLMKHFSQKLILENQEKTSSSSTVSDKPLSRRVFKLDSPFTNSSALFPVNNSNFERVRVDSESSEISVPHSLENLNSFESNGLMTDSMVNYLEKEEVSCRPPVAFQDEESMTDSLISLPENREANDVLSIGRSEPMTDSLVNYLVTVNCKPPSGFEDTTMTDSVINVDEKDNLPSHDMSNSTIINYLENVRTNSSDPLTDSRVSNETENIPPDNCDYEDEITINHSSSSERLKASGDGRIEEIAKLNCTYQLEKNGDLSNEIDEMANIMFTNSVNISRMRKGNGDIDDDLNIQRTLNTTFDKEFKENSERNIKTKALNNRDLNVTKELNCEAVKDLNTTKSLVKEQIPNRCDTTFQCNDTKRNEVTQDELNKSLCSNRHIPQRNSTFNTTFTKLHSDAPSMNSTFTKLQLRSSRGLNTTFAKSTEGLNGGLEDDQSSSASDSSSFSSCSTKPRSFDELRSIAQEQERSLVHQTSTPTESSAKSSANLVSRLQQPSMDSRRQNLQASSMSNIARPKVSGMRLPQPINRFTAPQVTGSRPSTAPTPACTAIPRPMASRLPMPRFRASGIPSLKRGGHH